MLASVLSWTPTARISKSLNEDYMTCCVEDASTLAIVMVMGREKRHEGVAYMCKLPVIKHHFCYGLTYYSPKVGVVSLQLAYFMIQNSHIATAIIVRFDK